MEQDAVLLQRMVRIHDENNVPADDVIYQGYTLSLSTDASNLTEQFTTLIKCLKKLVDFDTNGDFQALECERYKIDDEDKLTRRELSRLCDATASSISEKIEAMCRSYYIIAPLTHFDGCPKSDSDVEDAGVVLYGNMDEGNYVKYDGNVYQAVDEQLETNEYYTIKCFTLMPV